MLCKFLVVPFLFSSLIQDKIAPPQNSPSPITKTKTKTKNLQQATKQDLGAVFLRFEQTLLSNPLKPQEIARVNEEFDRLTSDFFVGNYNSACRKLSELTLQIDSKSKQDAAARLWRSIFVTADPAVASAKVKPEIKVHFRSYLDRPLEPSAKLVFTVSREGDAEFVINQMQWQGFNRPYSVLLKPASKPVAGSYRVLLFGETLNQPGICRFSILEETAEQLRKSNQLALDALLKTPPKNAVKGWSRAVGICAARNRLLVDVPSASNSTEFLANAFQLSKSLQREILDLSAGNNPYRNRRGDYWRTFDSVAQPLPMRCYVPPNIAGNKPAPLVMLFHGAGGDENMFLEAYGAGEIKRQADKHGFIVASLPTSYFLLSPINFDRVLQQLCEDYSIDAKRIYVMGHSMGTGVTGMLCGQRAEKIAAGCSLAGFGYGNITKDSPPMLVMSGRRDRIVPFPSVEKSVKRAIADGAKIDFRPLEDWGHTLFVGPKLAEVCDWLLAKSK